MNPEDYLRRLRDDDAWDLEAAPRASTRRSAAAGSSGSGRRQAWTTAVVAVAVVAVAGIAIGVSPATGSGAAGPGGPAATPQASVAASAEPTPTLTAEPTPAQPSPTPSLAAEPSAALQRATTHGGLPDIAFVAADRADVARGERAVACLHDKGVEYVDLAAPDDQGVRYLEFGGLRNDERSISLGLQYADGCIAAASH